MANKYKRFFRNHKYTFVDLINNYNEIERRYSEASYSLDKGKIIVDIQLKPSKGSLKYSVRLIAKIGSTNVDVFVMRPNIRELKKSFPIPHLYPNGSLCLYYPDYNEWNPNDFWADTLIPWTCLWLYYFELWLATGKWLGGGIHPGDVKKKSTEDVTSIV